MDDSPWIYRTDIIDGPTTCGQLERGRERIDLPLLFDISERTRVLYPLRSDLYVKHEIVEGSNGFSPINSEIEKALERAGAGELKTGVGLFRNRFLIGKGDDLFEVPILSERLSSVISDDPMAMRKVLVNLKKELPGAPLYLPGTGGWDDLEVLLYLGVEIFDTSRAGSDGFKGIYYTDSSCILQERLKVLGEPSAICSCDYCRKMDDEGISRLLISHHNVKTIVRRIALAHFRLKEGTLREHVMGILSGKPGWMSVLRYLEDGGEWDILSRTPTFKKMNRVPVTYRDDLDAPEFRLWRKRIEEDFTPLPHKRILLLLPCSAAKPYSISRTHQRIGRELHSLKGWNTVCQRLVVTSPLGAVPMELDGLYPASHYDIPVTGSWYPEEIDYIRNLTKSLIEKGEFDSVVCYHRDGFKFFKEESEEGSLEGIDFVDIHSASVKEEIKPDQMLRKVLTAEMIGPMEHGRKENEVLEALKMIEFSLGAEIHPIEGMKVKRTRRGADLRIGRTLLFNLNRGGPVPTLEGAKLIWESGGLVRKVTIDDFTPKGTLFSQGVLKAEGRIHPGDIVLIGTGDELRAVGRAVIPGEIMTSGIRGKAVEVISYLK